MPKIEIPPPGKAKPFDEWAVAIVAGVRTYLPDVRAVRKGGSRLVIIRHGEREAHLTGCGKRGAFGAKPLLFQFFTFRRPLVFLDSREFRGYFFAFGRTYPVI
jgi:hypothetical protein